MRVEQLESWLNNIPISWVWRAMCVFGADVWYFVPLDIKGCIWHWSNESVKSKIVQKGIKSVQWPMKKTLSPLLPQCSVLKHVYPPHTMQSRNAVSAYRVSRYCILASQSSILGLRLFDLHSLHRFHFHKGTPRSHSRLLRERLKSCNRLCRCCGHSLRKEKKTVEYCIYIHIGCASLPRPTTLSKFIYKIKEWSQV